VTPTDAELLRAARRDADAFAELYDRYARRAVGWARRGGVAEPDVVDLAAELFAEAWRSRRRFRDPGDGSASELELAVAGLPPAQATAVRLRIVDELPYDEIASRLSCTPVTARKRAGGGWRGSASSRRSCSRARARPRRSSRPWAIRPPSG
jgi:RNA polymerase sigma-70 factor (ECF subfamily)